MHRPSPLPQVDNPAATAAAFAQGWWAGVAVGAVSSLALAVLVGWLR